AACHGGEATIDEPRTPHPPAWTRARAAPGPTRRRVGSASPRRARVPETGPDNRKRELPLASGSSPGAVDGIRTRGLNLGRIACSHYTTTARAVLALPANPAAKTIAMPTAGCQVGAARKQARSTVTGP